MDYRPLIICDMSWKSCRHLSIWRLIIGYICDDEEEGEGEEKKKKKKKKKKEEEKEEKKEKKKNPIL